VAISHNDKVLATASYDRTVKIIDTRTMEEVATIKGHKRAIWDIKFSHFEKLVATASSDNTIKIWSLVDYSCVATLEGHESSVLKIQWASLGSQIISCNQ
jgi:U3 small nucleolar RNA-associated protein 13